MAKCDAEYRAWQQARAPGTSPQVLKAARDAYRQCMKDNRAGGATPGSRGRRGAAALTPGRPTVPGVTPLFCRAIARAADNLDGIAANLRKSAANLVANSGGDPWVAYLAHSLEQGADLEEARAKGLRNLAKQLGCKI